MEKSKKMFNALLQECKVKEVHQLVEIVVEQESNRKDVCQIIGIEYDVVTMKHCSRNMFAQRATRILKEKILKPVLSAMGGGK